MEVQQGNRNCNHSLKREKPARCAGIPLEPLNECCLAVKRMPLADGGALAALGDVAVDDSGELQAPGEVEEGGDDAEVADGGLGSGGGGGELEFGDDVVGATEVDLADDFGLAVDALGLAGVVVGVAADDLLDEAGHELSHTLAQI